jgi:SAM-dependent methyltransferase
VKAFQDYGRYYDLLNRDKDYAAEVRFIDGILKRHRHETREVLELGCGTGVFARELATQGYRIHGVDRSDTMLEVAALRADPQVSFSKQDIRHFQLNEKFDAAVSLFHVMSYQTSNEDLVSALLCAKRHLRSGGLFVFDCWYGPAVLTERPTNREKHFEDDFLRVTRSSRPTLHPNHNRVDVEFQIEVLDKQTGRVQKLQELHPMRYFFKPELDLVFGQVGFELLEWGQWLKSEQPSDRTWYVYFVLRPDLRVSE